MAKEGMDFGTTLNNVYEIFCSIPARTHSPERMVPYVYASEIVDDLCDENGANFKLGKFTLRIENFPRLQKGMWIVSFGAYYCNQYMGEVLDMYWVNDYLVFEMEDLKISLRKPHD